jgi:hypothetical protein
VPESIENIEYYKFGERKMSAPSKAGTYKLDNPTWIKPNQQSRTKPRT